MNAAQLEMTRRQFVVRASGLLVSAAIIDSVPPEMWESLLAQGPKRLMVPGAPFRYPVNLMLNSIHTLSPLTRALIVNTPLTYKDDHMVTVAEATSWPAAVDHIVRRVPVAARAEVRHELQAIQAHEIQKAQPGSVQVVRMTFERIGQNGEYRGDGTGRFVVETMAAKRGTPGYLVHPAPTRRRT